MPDPRQPPARPGPERPPAPGYPLPAPPGRSHHRGARGRYYTLGTRDGVPWISCDRCGRISSHHQDVAWRYCGGWECRTFLDEPVGPGTVTPTTFSDGREITDALAAWHAEAGDRAEAARGDPDEGCRGVP